MFPIKDNLVAGKHVVEYIDGEKRLLLHCGLSGVDRANDFLTYTDNFENIKKVYEIKKTLPLKYLLTDENLELIWENKDEEKEGE